MDVSARRVEAVTLAVCRYLHRTIQSGSHDSVDDARATMELALLKIKYGPEFGTPQGKSQQGMQLTSVLERKNLRSCFVDRPGTVQRYVKGNSSGISVNSDIQAVSSSPPGCLPLLIPIAPPDTAMCLHWRLCTDALRAAGQAHGQGGTRAAGGRRCAVHRDLHTSAGLSRYVFRSLELNQRRIPQGCGSATTEAKWPEKVQPTRYQSPT